MSDSSNDSGTNIYTYISGVDRELIQQLQFLIDGRCMLSTPFTIRWLLVRPSL